MVEDSGATLLVFEPGMEGEIAGLPAYSLAEYRAAVAAEPATPLADNADFVVPAAEVYTSGTTGRPKAVERSNVGRASGQLPRVLGLAGVDETHLCCAPVYHSQPRAFAQFASPRDTRSC